MRIEALNKLLDNRQKTWSFLSFQVPRSASKRNRTRGFLCKSTLPSGTFSARLFATRTPWLSMILPLAISCNVHPNKLLYSNEQNDVRAFQVRQKQMTGGRGDLQVVLLQGGSR